MRVVRREKIERTKRENRDRGSNERYDLEKHFSPSSML